MRKRQAAAITKRRHDKMNIRPTFGAERMRLMHHLAAQHAAVREQRVDDFIWPGNLTVWRHGPT